MKNKKLPVGAIVLSVIFAVLARVSGIVYSTLATNVVYSTTILCTILPYLQQILSALSFASAAGGAMAVFFGKYSTKPMLIAYAVIALVENTVPLAMDLLAGMFADDPARLILGIGYRLGMAAYSVVTLIIGTAIARGIVNRDGSKAVAVVFAAVLPVVIDFFVVFVRSLVSLIEWDFMPYKSEIISIASDFGTVLLAGVMAGVCAVLLTTNGRKE